MAVCSVSISLACIAIAIFATLPSVDAAELFDIGSRRELFIDTAIVQASRGAEIALCEPVDCGPVLAFNQAWERPFCMYCTVIHDGERYRLYYRGLPTAGTDETNSEVTCYAESL